MVFDMFRLALYLPRIGGRFDFSAINRGGYIVMRTPTNPKLVIRLRQILAFKLSI